MYTWPCSAASGFPPLYIHRYQGWRSFMTIIKSLSLQSLISVPKLCYSSGIINLENISLHIGEYHTTRNTTTFLFLHFTDWQLLCELRPSVCTCIYHRAIGGKKRVSVIFQGGANDREALRISLRFTRHEDVSLEVFALERSALMTLQVSIWKKTYVVDTTSKHDLNTYRRTYRIKQN